MSARRWNVDCAETLQASAHKKACSTPRDAATSTSRTPNRCESLELEYATSLIRVIRSRKAQDSKAQANVLSPPPERSVPAVENVILLSGCEKFNLSTRRSGSGKLAPLAYLGDSLRRMSDSEGWASCESDAGHCSRAETRQYTSSNARRPLAGDSCNGVARIASEGRSPASRRRELCILRRVQSPPGNDSVMLTASEMCAGKELRAKTKYSSLFAGLARGSWLSPKKKENIRQNYEDFETYSNVAEAAAGPGIAQYTDSDVLSTLQICKNCNDMFEDAFSQARIEQCTALINCACDLIEKSSVGRDAEMVQLAARTWTNVGLLHSHKREMQQAVDSFTKALTFRMGTRDMVALATAHANLALALFDLDEMDQALEHGRLGLEISLDALQLGPVHTLSSDDIPQGSDSQQLLKTVATSLLVQGSVNERLGRECLTSYRSAMFFARHLVSGSESLSEKTQQAYASALQQELSLACSTRDDTMFHSKLFNTAKVSKNVQSSALQQELAAGRTGKTSRRFLLGAEIEFEGPKQIQSMRNGLPMQSRHLRNLAAACTLTIQCAFRCARARKCFTVRQETVIELFGLYASYPHHRLQASKVQRVFRGHLARRLVRSLVQHKQHSSILLLQACLQRRLQHTALVRRLAIEADAHLPVASLNRARWLPPAFPVRMPTSVAVTARSLIAAVGLRSCKQQTLLHCAAVLGKLGYSGDDMDTFFYVLLNRESQGTIDAELFYDAILKILLLSAEADDAEDVREACEVFDLLQHRHRPTLTNSSAFLSSLGYSDEEVNAVMEALECDEEHKQIQLLERTIALVQNAKKEEEGLQEKAHVSEDMKEDKHAAVKNMQQTSRPAAEMALSLEAVDANHDGKVDDVTLKAYLAAYTKYEVEYGALLVGVRGAVLHRKGESKPYSGINGDFKRSDEICNRRAVYTHISMPWAMWWSNNNGRLGWCVGRKDQVGTDSMCAFVEGIGFGPEEVGKRPWSVFSYTSESWEEQTGIEVVSLDRLDKNEVEKSEMDDKRSGTSESTGGVSREAFVHAMSAMLCRARQVRSVEDARRHVAADVALYEPYHPLLCISRKNASILLQCAWRAKRSRAALCKAMGRSFSGTCREVLVFLVMQKEFQGQEKRANAAAIPLQCASRTFIARKRVYRERLERPMRLIRRMRWNEEQAAGTIQKWLLWFASTRPVRMMRRERACSTVVCNVRMWLARRDLQQARRQCAAYRIQYFLLFQVALRRRRRFATSLLLQNGVRCWLSRRRVAALQEERNLSEVRSWQARSFAASIVADAYRAFRARRSLQDLSRRRHIDRVVVPLIARVVRGHLERKSYVNPRRQERMDQRKEASALLLQQAVRQHTSRQRLLQRLRDGPSRLGAAVRLETLLRRALARQRYLWCLSGHPAAECLQRAWLQRRARKSVAAMRLIPYFQRVASAGLSALFLVRVAEQRAGLPSGSICVHCLQVFACGHSSMPHTCTSTLARPTPPPESVTPSPRQPTCSAAEVTVRHSAQVEKTVTHPLLSDEYRLKFTAIRRADQASMSAQGAQAHVTRLTGACRRPAAGGIFTSTASSAGVPESEQLKDTSAKEKVEGVKESEVELVREREMSVQREIARLTDAAQARFREGKFSEAKLYLEQAVRLDQSSRGK